jgi:LPXTG-motif cell wall-anchored protein
VVTVPTVHTGQPWSGWPWWAAAGGLGLVGFGLLVPWKRRLRRSD